MTHRSPYRWLSRIVLISGAAVFAAAQTVGTQQASAAKDTITEASIRGHMEFLASDAMKGRGSGTEDEWRAAVYIGSQMRRWGIEPLGDKGGFVKEIEAGRVPAGRPVLTVGDVKLTDGREMLVQSFGRGLRPGPLVVYKAGANVAVGTWVLVPAGVTPNPAEIGSASALLTVESEHLPALWDDLVTRLPNQCGLDRRGTARMTLTKEAFNSLAAAAGGGTATATLQVETKPGRTWNAIGEIKGADPAMANDVILLTAHLDHIGVGGVGPDVICNGADDDASGSTAVLELAEALAKGPRPKRTVLFAWFGSEENGGAGASDFLAHPPVPLDRIVANLEFEMIANRDPAVAAHTLWLTGYERSNLGPELARQGARIVADPHPSQQFFQRSDNIQLACRGVIAQTVSTFDPASRTYHQPSDEVAAVDFAQMTESIQSMFGPVSWLANSTFKPDWLPGKKPLPGQDPCR